MSWHLQKDIQLLIDLGRSILRYQGMLKERSVRFWHYETKEGINFKLRRDVWDSAVIIENWWAGEYLKDLKKIENEPTIIDVGAHIGSFSVFMAIKFDNAKVFAFEPNPDNFELLHENIEINRLENKIFPFEVAVDSEEGNRAKFYLHPDNLGMHSLLYRKPKSPRYEQKKRIIEVETISLKEIFEKNRISKCDLLKMDCEGCEYNVLYGTPKDILEKIKIITIECHPEGDKKELKKYLEQSGFITEFDWLINPIIGRALDVPLLKAWRAN